MRSNHRHVVFVQYGDYREAVVRFASGGLPTYAGQKGSVEFVAGLVSPSCDVTVIALPPQPYDEMLVNGVRGIGMGWKGGALSEARLLMQLERLRPTHLVLCTPLLSALLWGVRRVGKVLPLLADSFDLTSPPRWISRFRRRLSAEALVRALNLDDVSVVANHNVPASLELAKLGVDPAKVVPWDWPAENSPHDRPPKSAPAASRPVKLFFAGGVSEAKGVGDLIAAVAVLKSRHVDVRLEVAGNGALDAMRKLAADQGVGDRVTLLGKVPNSDVFEMMRSSEIVVVPSRNSYPEGLPMTIYEGLCSRTPLLVSTHRMFVSAFGETPGVKMFEAGNPVSLADAVQEITTDPNAYESLSRDSAVAWERIQVPLKSNDLITRWLEGTQEDIAFIRQYAVAHRPVP